MKYNTIDYSYNKAIKDYGVVAILGDTETKVLIREITDPKSDYGIDYKKIISSRKIEQGNYVSINKVKFLICAKEEQMTQSIYNVAIFRKTLPILLGSEYKPVDAIVNMDKNVLLNGQYIEEVHDQYQFIIPKNGNDIGVNTEIVYNMGIYKTISVDETKDNLYYVIAKYKDIYNPHKYTITLNETSKTLKETEIFNIIATCTDNDVVVSEPVVTYVSSDDSVATVDNNGVVTCIGAGSCTITYTYNKVDATLNLVVEEKPAEPIVSYTHTWSKPIDSLRNYCSSTLTVTKIENGTETPCKITYSLDTLGQSYLSGGKIKITVKANNSIQIKNVSATEGKTIVLTIKDSEDDKIILEQNIKLISGF